MKKTLLTMMICVIALCLHGDTQDEVRSIIRELVEGSTEPRTQNERWMRIDQLWRDLKAREPDDAFPVYYKMLEENFDDPKYVNWIMMRFLEADGYNWASNDKQEALDWARKVLRSENERFDKINVTTYLTWKGDERDLDLIVVPECRNLLATRVAGTNIIDYIPLPGSKVLFEYGKPQEYICLPSVTNIGPQALYVAEILHQCWEKLEVETRVIKGYSHPISFKDTLKIPPELLTMVVWFDAGGNPVCNVDLAKYGQAMPEIDLPPKVKDEVLRRSSGSAGLPPCR